MKTDQSLPKPNLHVLGLRCTLDETETVVEKIQAIEARLSVECMDFQSLERNRAEVTRRVLALNYSARCLRDTVRYRLTEAEAKADAAKGKP